MEKIFVVGSAGHALVVEDIIAKEQRFNVVGLLDPFRTPGTVISGYPVLGGQADIPRLSADMGVRHTVIAIGDNWDRYSVYREVAASCPQITFPTSIHPSAQIGKNVSIGEGSVVMPGAIVNNGAEIGRFCIVNTAASIDHECHIGDFASIAPGATLGGKVAIGAYSAISLGAKIVHKISIGDHVVVGAGALVLGDLTDQVLAYGSPARPIRNRKIGERYI